MEPIIVETPKSIKEDALARDIGYVPNDWQKIVDKAHARYMTLNIGRRGGKTLFVAKSPVHGIVRDLILPNRHVWIVAPNYDLTQRVWTEVKKLTQVPNIKGIITRLQDTKGNYKIETALGTVIEAKSAKEPEMLIGAGLDKVIIDEASRVPEAAWFQALLPSLLDKNGQAIFISTPRGRNWFHDVYKMGLDNNVNSSGRRAHPDYKSFKFSSYENNYLPAGAIDELKKGMPSYQFRQEIMAEFTDNIEQIFRVENIKRLSKLSPKVPTGVRTMGIDLGKGLSYTVIYVLESDGSCSYFDRFQGDWDEQVKKISQAIAEQDVPYARIDATGKGDPIVEQLEYAGVAVEPFIFSTSSKKQLMDKLALAIERGLISLPTEPDIQFKELEAMGREKTLSGNEIYKPMKKITDDCVMALALAVWDMDLQEYADKKKEEKAGTIFNEAVPYPDGDY